MVCVCANIVCSLSPPTFHTFHTFSVVLLVVNGSLVACLSFPPSSPEFIRLQSHKTHTSHYFMPIASFKLLQIKLISTVLRYGDISHVERNTMYLNISKLRKKCVSSIHSPFFHQFKALNLSIEGQTLLCEQLMIKLCVNCSYSNTSHCRVVFCPSLHP
eukprot:TRINITY_DN3115_c0_g5_i1.p2 TRINITY_DN3115_c0_g5~~TRINITY_DN3115_c0_g5_i1.p2  ORF type:complete len:159 (+),score=3.17 TRINITY_DN3115_c0_g5_i1:153-629(+)